MALYEDYLNQNNLYTRPSAMMSNVNDYLGANRASLPMNQDSLGSMMGKPMLDGNDDTTGGGGSGSGGIKTWKDRDDETDGDGDGGGGEDDRRDPTPPHAKTGLLPKFIQDLGALDDNQQGLLLDFITGGGQYGDTSSGVSAEEYAQLFGVSDDYSGRFQGFPNLTNLYNDISNVFAYQNQQRGFEQRAAQQAQIAQGGAFQGGRGFGGLIRGRGMSNALSRRQMQDTLNQRQAAVDEATSGKYGTLLSHLQSALRGGFTTAGQILQENPGATFGDESNIKVGQTRVSGGDLEYWDGSAWVDRETYLRNQDERGQG